MRITVVGRGNLGGGLADLWERAGHQVTRLGRDGGDVSDADAILVAVPGGAIAEAFDRLRGFEGRTAIDATNLYNVTPPEGRRGQTLTVAISGTGLNFTEASKPNFGPDVRVLTTQVINASNLQIDIEIAPEAAIGRRRIWITTAGGQTAIDNSPDGVFQVVAVRSPDK